MDARLYEYTPPDQLSFLRTTLLPQPTVRRFTDEHIQLAIDRATAHLSGETKGAVVAHADLDGASLSVVAKLGDHWSVAAAAYKPFNGKLSAEAEVVFSW